MPPKLNFSLKNLPKVTSFQEAQHTNLASGKTGTSVVNTSTETGSGSSSRSATPPANPIGGSSSSVVGSRTSTMTAAELSPCSSDTILSPNNGSNKNLKNIVDKNENSQNETTMMQQSPTTVAASTTTGSSSSCCPPTTSTATAASYATNTNTNKYQDWLPGRAFLLADNIKKVAQEQPGLFLVEKTVTCPHRAKAEEEHFWTMSLATHPNVLRYLKFLKVPSTGGAVITMEYANRTTLKEMIYQLHSVNSNNSMMNRTSSSGSNNSENQHSSNNNNSTTPISPDSGKTQVPNHSNSNKSSPSLSTDYSNDNNNHHHQHHHNLPPFDQTTRENVAKAVARQVLDALLFYYRIHARFHRDVKPDNLFLRSDGCIKLSDFDVSKVAQTMACHGGSVVVPAAADSKNTTNSSCAAAAAASFFSSASAIGGAGGGVGAAANVGGHSMIGTIDYMSPDYVRQYQDKNYKKVDPAKADVYSVGCVLFHIIFGAPPFPGRNPISNPVQMEEVTELVETTLNSVQDQMLRVLLRRCLTWDSNKRACLAEAAAISYLFFLPSTEEMETNNNNNNNNDDDDSTTTRTTSSVVGGIATTTPSKICSCCITITDDNIEACRKLCCCSSSGSSSSEVSLLLQQQIDEYGQNVNINGHPLSQFSSSASSSKNISHDHHHESSNINEDVSSSCSFAESIYKLRTSLLQELDSFRLTLKSKTLKSIFSKYFLALQQKPNNASNNELDNSVSGILPPTPSSFSHSGSSSAIDLEMSTGGGGSSNQQQHHLYQPQHYSPTTHLSRMTSSTSSMMEHPSTSNIECSSNTNTTRPSIQTKSFDTTSDSSSAASPLTSNTGAGASNVSPTTNPLLLSSSSTSTSSGSPPSDVSAQIQQHQQQEQQQQQKDINNTTPLKNKSNDIISNNSDNNNPLNENFYSFINPTATVQHMSPTEGFEFKQQFSAFLKHFQISSKHGERSLKKGGTEEQVLVRAIHYAIAEEMRNRWCERSRGVYEVMKKVLCQLEEHRQMKNIK